MRSRAGKVGVLLPPKEEAAEQKVREREVVL